MTDGLLAACVLVVPPFMMPSFRSKAIENRLLIRRLVFERLLYSEMGEFEKLRTLDIEYRISADISQTLSFFSFTLPQIVGSVYALMREGFELYKHRQHVDPLALAHPVLIGSFSQLF